MKPKERVEPIVALLFGGLVFFTGMVFMCEHFYKDDGQLFQVISNLLSAFSGAFFMRIKARGTETPQVPPGTTTATVTTAVPEPPKEE